MIRRRFLVGAAAATLIVSACSGNDDDGSPSPTPTPSSSASGTPTPTPEPSYAAFPLPAASPSPAAVAFRVINATTSYNGDLAGSTAVRMNAVTTEPLVDDRISIGMVPLYTAANTTERFVIAYRGTESRFASSNATTAPATTVPYYVFRKTGTDGKFEEGSFLNNTLSTLVSTDASVARKHVSSASLWFGASTAGDKRLTYTVWGYPSIASYLPKTGSVTYTSRVTGRVVRANSAGNGGTTNELSGTVNTSVNFVTGAVNLTLTLNSVATDGTTTPYVTITGTGGRQVETEQFSGTFNTTNGIGGTFNGSLYGAQGLEIGIVFGLTGNPNGVEQRAVGSIVGTKVAS